MASRPRTLHIIGKPSLDRFHILSFFYISVFYTRPAPSYLLNKHIPIATYDTSLGGLSGSLIINRLPDQMDAPNS